MTVYNRLSVLPTQATLDYLSSVLSGASVDIDLNQYSVEIITTLDEVVAMPLREYHAQTSSLKIWYDSYLQKSSLILSLVSNDLEARAVELNQLGILREFYNYYNPYMTIVPSMPSLSKHHRHFVVSAANALMANSENTPLVFSGEFVTQVALEAPLNYEFNQAMFEERLSRQNLA